nr:hypothetical protein [Micromonospora sp. DSM 115978]
AANASRLVRRRRSRVAARSVAAAVSLSLVAALVVVSAEGGGADDEGDSAREIRAASPLSGFPEPTATWTSGFQPVVAMQLWQYTLGGVDREVHLAVGSFAAGSGNWMVPDSDQYPGALWACLFDRAAEHRVGLGQSQGCRLFEPPPANQPAPELVNIYVPAAD